MDKKEFADHIVNDKLGHIGGITSRAMFGGYGIYKDGVFCGIIADNTLYFKVDDTNKADYQAHGSSPFTYVKPSTGKPYEMSYWEVPEDVLNNPDEVKEWLERSYVINRKRKRSDV